jgi:hypothetical protein
VDEAVQQADFGDFDDWTLRDNQVALSIEKVYEELDGELK